MRRPPLLALLAALVALTVAPVAASASSGTKGGKGPLRMNHVQARGSHNSTHQDHNGSLPGVPPWDYSHPALDVQLEEQGVRQVELDLHFNWARDDIEVYHVWFADDRSSCTLLRDCLALIRSWSDAHPGHHPLLVLLEPKDGPLEDEDPFTRPFGTYEYQRLDEILREVWPDRVVTPDSVTGRGTTLRQSIVERGWPKLADVRQHVTFLIDGDDHGTAYSNGYTSLAGRMSFVQAPEESPVAAFVGRGGGSGKYDRMSRLVAQGFMVRDLAGDPRAALAAGAHYISNDTPTMSAYDDAGMRPSRCNPVTTLDVSCTAEAIETHAHRDGYATSGTVSGDDPAAVIGDKVDRLVVRSATAAADAVTNGRQP
ncbi:MAG TPA: Ca2+-dependent phosphoinositide-specific phospholipase C [Acidimicrobiales bacterium]|jgi:hypothetical protein|nr:Ca2+-dependent phosphoinositide-specific phospholipase C [Acidimicrobiales bacterium]